MFIIGLGPIGFLNEILLTTGIFSHLIASSGPRIRLEAFLLMFFDRKSPVLFRNVGLKCPEPKVNRWDVGIYLESQSVENRLIDMQTILHMPDSDDNAIESHGWILLYSDGKWHYRSIVFTRYPPGQTLSPCGPGMPGDDFGPCQWALEWNPISVWHFFRFDRI